MKKSTKIIIAIVAIIIIIAIIATVLVFSQKKGQTDNQGQQQNNNQPAKSNLNITSEEDMKKLIDQMYQGLETYPTVNTTVVDIADQNAVTNATGLASTEKIENIVISEPMISSQAYSAVLVKVKNASDADSIAKEINEKVNAYKWVCVGAEKVYTTSSGNIVCLVMSSEEMAKPVYESFKKIAGGIGQEYVRETNEGIIDNGDALPAL